LRRAYGDLATVVGAERVTFGQIEVDLVRLEVRKQGQTLDLTPTEFRLLHHMVAHPNRPLSREALIEAVWGYDSDIGSHRTVDVHVRHLREKLEDDPADPRWIVTVRGLGYKLEV
jgi:DNA-binding response OmpR family regulator